ncbi:WAT1-related protein At2g39510-like [Impatiens glandulifera]|uniref:WAT1-related protein At2g39510-like n=1 Tax=Impatiens glandulifera TaxID=253017 RepID=UPI001FB0B0DD|nr:WAT1-related protein At2g39510-like [Impatiens glandulifera]
MWSFARLQAMIPWAGVILVQVLAATNSLITKAALNKGMQFAVFALYRNIIASAFLIPLLYFRRNSIPRMSRNVMWKIVMLTILEPVIDQNILYAGSKMTPASFSTCLSGVTPSLIFLLAWSLGMEQVNFKERRSQAKLLGTVIAAGGAILICLYNGPAIAVSSKSQTSTTHEGFTQNWIEGPVFVIIANVSYVVYCVTMGSVLVEYPSPLTIISIISFLGAIMNVGVALGLELKHPASWMIGWNVIFLAYVYTGIIVSGVMAYIISALTQMKGPVFVAAFSPTSMVLVMVIGFLALGESIHVGSLIGTFFIVAGLFTLLWGKSGTQPPQSEEEPRREEQEMESMAPTETIINSFTGRVSWKSTGPSLTKIKERFTHHDLLDRALQTQFHYLFKAPTLFFFRNHISSDAYQKNQLKFEGDKVLDQW